ncbi:hypothetical protein M011DRAFT_469686 [Sporormia fimetaria CBS 119925]|uniref:Mediator of RNA polymerase II transcription subunit 13 n=1 Tax=Sporormia fimetaria CBS 119925 TaxID=1340428 RepID=A0A6A6V836_9PLEO|nr:hypothetical protein M011DRAFT_469686 [Sporormia fimetaria CBS 119925]
MEFLKTCNTNAQSIGGFEAIFYQAFSVTRTGPPSEPDAFDIGPAPALSAVEALLRQQKELVIQDATRPWLWLFRATALDKPEEPGEPPVVEGYSLQRENSGVMKALELIRPAVNRPPTPHTTSILSAPSTPIPPRDPQNDSALPSKTHAMPHEPSTMYTLFTSALVALISYRFVKQYDATALNFRTFLSRPKFVDKDEKFNATIPYTMSNLNVHWTSNGTLLVSTSTVVQPAIHCLSELSTSEAQNQILGRCIRIAPNGTLAKVAGFDDPLDVATEQSDKRRKRARKGPFELGIERWKSFLLRWLSWKGYSTSGMESKSSWVRIALSQQSLSPTPGFHPSRDVLWPRALCFFYDNPREFKEVFSLLDGPEDVLDWFATAQSTGYRDPIDEAQEWFLGKAEREAAIEARRKAKKAEEDALRAKEDVVTSVLPSSPLNSRTAVYGDLQAAGGMYPTPPDGVPPGTHMSQGDTPSLSSNVANTALLQGVSHPAINVSAPVHSTTSETQQSVVSPDFNTRFENFNAAPENVDLFEGMDEDDFGGNGVTDADFNFFDEPDSNDIEMQDAPAAVVKVEPHPKPVEATAEQDLGAMDTQDGNAPDSMTALDNALALASAAALRESDESSREIHVSKQLRGPLVKAGASILSPAAPQYHSPMQIDTGGTVNPTTQGVPPSTNSVVVGGIARPSRRESAFDPVHFDEKLTASDAKYHRGRFTFAEDTKNPGPKSSKLSVLRPLKTSAIASRTGLPAILAESDAERDSSDTESETSSESDDAEVAPSTILAPFSAGLGAASKRKLPMDGNATPLSVTSCAESFVTDTSDIPRLATDEASIALFEASPWDWSLAEFPPPVELPSATARYNVPVFSPSVASLPGTPTSQPDTTVDPIEESPLSKTDCIYVVQVVTDQIVSATTDVLHETTGMPPSLTAPTLHTALKDSVKDVFPKADECNISGLLSVNDAYPELPPQAKAQQRPQRRPGEGPGGPGGHILPVQPPFVRVRRSDTAWELLPPAVAFWESLGLGPCSASKNVGAVCIYPHSESLKSCLLSFFINLRVAYEGLKLGGHEQVELGAAFAQGFIPWTIKGPISTRSAFRTLREACKILGRALAAKHAEKREDEPRPDAYVVYMINPFEDGSAVWELCSAFWSLFQAYGQAPSSRTHAVSKPDVVLQIIPIRNVASFRVPVTLDAYVYANLAREVYDRCPPPSPSDDKSPLSIYAAPCFQLEETVPRRIDFRLQSDPPQDMLRDNSYMHVGYAISLDGNWVTAAWTDSSGKSRAVVSYHLSTRAFSEIAREIWNTTLELLQARKVTWRICLAKCGSMEKEEVDAWHFLATVVTQSVNFFVILLTFDPNPPFQLTPTMAGTTSQANTTQSTSKTPVSTPQAGVSPDTPSLTPAPTPAADAAADPSNDPDARLVDVTDESWAIILACRLHNTNSTVEFRPCLISGLLVKRGLPHPTSPPPPGVPDPEPGPLVAGVNIIWINAMAPTRASATASASSPFPVAADGVSPGGASTPISQTPTASTPVSSTPTSAGTERERDRMSLVWTPTPQHRATAETLLKEVLSQYRGLGTLARLKGIRGSRMGVVPWHIAVAKRGVEGLEVCVPNHL